MGSPKSGHCLNLICFFLCGASLRPHTIITGTGLPPGFHTKLGQGSVNSLGTFSPDLTHSEIGNRIAKFIRRGKNWRERITVTVAITVSITTVFNPCVDYTICSINLSNCWDSFNFMVVLQFL